MNCYRELVAIGPDGRFLESVVGRKSDDAGLSSWESQWPRSMSVQEHMALWRCRSLPELRLKAAVMGLDEKAWLKEEGKYWQPDGYDFAGPSLPDYVVIMSRGRN